MNVRKRPGICGRSSARLAAVAVGLMLCLAASAAQAQSGKGEYVATWSAAAALGYAIPNTDEYDNTAAWRFAVGYSPVPQFEIDFELGGFTSGVSQPEEGGLPSHTIASGQLGVRPLCLSLQYRTPLPEALSTLTLLAGVGYYFVDYTMADEAREALGAGAGEDAVDQTVDDDWGFHVGAGLEYAISERVSLVGEGRYLFLSPGVAGTAGSGFALGGSIDLNAWLFSGGVKVAF